MQKINSIRDIATYLCDYHVELPLGVVPRSHLENCLGPDTVQDLIDYDAIVSQEVIVKNPESTSDSKIYLEVCFIDYTRDAQKEIDEQEW